MKKFAKRCLAVLLSIAMVLTMVPVSMSAEATTDTYSKISSKTELTTGKYVMIVNTGYAPGAYENYWLTATQPTVTGEKVINPDSTSVWTLTVLSDGTTSLTGASGKAMSPKLPQGGKPQNGIIEGDYSWVIEENGGLFKFKGQSDNPVTLASNASTGTQYPGENRFRAYKDSTIAGAVDTYPCAFTLYKLAGGGTPGTGTKTASPIATPGSGVVASGTAIELTCPTDGAKIQYTTGSGIFVDYSNKIIVNGPTTITAKATAPNYDVSDTVMFDYAIKTTPPITTVDPIKTLPGGVKTIKEVLEMPVDATDVTKNEVTTIGQLVYRFGSNGNPNTAVLEDVISGQIMAIPVFNSFDDYKIGDVIQITGVKSQFGGVDQLGTITEIKIITEAAAAEKIPAQKFATINEMLAQKDDLLSEWVLLSNVKLGDYVTGKNATATVTDIKGNSIDVYSAAPYPYGAEKGDVVDLYACVSKYKTTDQLRIGTSADYVIVNDTKAPNITMPTLDKAEKGKDYPVSVMIQDNVKATQVTLTYTAIKGAPESLNMIQNASDSAKWETTVPVSKFAADIATFSISVEAKDAKGNTATTKAVNIEITDEARVTATTPTQNQVLGDVKRPVITVSCENAGTNPTAKLTLKASGVAVIEDVAMSYAAEKFSYTLSKDLADARYTAMVMITRADGKTTKYEWPFTVGTPKNRLYFGQMHSHTQYSDGSGSLDTALDYISKTSAKDNVNFVAFTDHSNYFDTKVEANPEGGLFDTKLMTAESQKIWSEYKGKITDFNNSKTNNGVVALGGFEMTWSGGPGHINTFNTPGIVSRNNKVLNDKANKTKDAGMQAYYKLLSQTEGADSISQLNHPGKTFGTFSDFAYWDPIIDSRVNMVEVGNGEGAIGSGGYFPSYNYYTMALDKGWHVAPTNNQDNHKGKWGNANDARDVIITDNFTEQGIYGAMRERRIYATEDKNLEINYTLNDQLMGSIIEKVPASLEVKVALSDADANDMIAKTELVANSGRVVKTWDVNAQSKELTATLSPDYSYYYIRVTEKDGDIAVTAPVWVGDTIKLGISNVESSTSTPVTKEEIKITTTLFNSETSDVTVKSLTYKMDGKVLSNVDNAGMIPKLSSLENTISFTPEKAKLQKISVEAVLTLKGVDYSFSKDVELDIRDADKLLYIGIDGSHQNEYVAGNYKDSMGNFSDLAAKSNVRCKILTTTEELLAATKNEEGKYKAIILTAPSRRNGSALRDPYSTYSDTEIAAIKTFSEAGGTLVLCGWSDNYESYKDFPAEDHMAAQQNKVLSALGTSLRISDDGTYDNVLNAGGSESNKARLYFSTYNFDNFLTQGITYDPEHKDDNKYSQLFSQYGGGSIYAVDKNGKPTSTLNAAVSPVVYAHSSTYSKDCDKDGLGGENTPKYECAKGDSRLMVLASETLTHANGNKSLVLVDGAAFMSNFEIQATVSDTNAELNYSNYNILENLIQFINPTEISKIADVQKEKEEGINFTVEGIVTSNASAYDKNTAFFDCIYLQDETAGINAFPVAGNFKVGQKVRINGTTSSYQSERQLNVSSIKMLNETPIEVKPKVVTAKDINSKKYLGSLVKISGTVTGFEVANGAVQNIIVSDENDNEARIFIDGYITTDKMIENLAEWSYITAVGLSSYDDTMKDLPARIRIRDRADIVCTLGEEPMYPVGPLPSTPEKDDNDDKKEESTVKVEKGESTVTNGKAEVKLEVSEEVLKSVVADKDGNITLELGEDALEKALTDKTVKNGVTVNLNIPNVKDVNVNKIILNDDVLEMAKKSGQDLTLNITNADKKVYSVSIPASELKKVSDDSENLNVAVSLAKNTKVSEKAVGILSVGTEGTLAVGMVVTVPAEDLSVKAGEKVYIYRKNAETGALEEIPNGSGTIAADGSLKLSTLSGGEFVICTAEEKSAVKLVDQIKVKARVSTKKGRRISVREELPQEFKKVKGFSKEEKLGQEEVKISYKVNDKSIAAVSKNGSLKAKKKGTVKVLVTVTLENGQKKTFTKKVKIK